MKKNKILKFIGLIAVFIMAIGISTTIKPLTAHAAYTTVTEGGKYTVHDIIVYATGKELTSATGQMNAVYRRATSVVKRQYGSVSANQRYKITYDTYSFPKIKKNVYSRGGGIDNVRVSKA